MRSHAAPPTRERALQLADALIHGGRRLWTSECDEIANYIRAQAELGDVLALDAPSATNVTDYEILRLARSYRDGSATDGERRQTCILALGIGPPVTSIGVRSPDLIAQARAWCAAQLHAQAQAQMESVGASPDPIDGPERHRPVRVRNRSRLAREMSGLLLRDAARQLGITSDALVMLEVSPVLAVYARGGAISERRDIVDIVAAMVKLYSVSRAWLVGDAPQVWGVAPSIWTPRDDGTCGVCGLRVRHHYRYDERIDGRLHSVLRCQPAVAP